MGGLILIIIGIIVAGKELIKDAMIKPCPPGTDIRAAVADSYANNLSAKESARRLDSGYYVKKDKK